MSTINTDFDVLSTTATQLRELLDHGKLTSVQIVTEYRSQISKHNIHGLGLRAIICTAPEDILLARAQQLDAERASGRVRSPLHGIPIVIKDVFMTSPDLGMPTTAGAVAFENSYARRNAAIVDRLLDLGLIILGKASMTEFCGLKATRMTAGWNALNGQTQSPYIYGGVKQEDLFIGRSTPGGSSSGSAVAVAAGFAPLALGTETSGSVCMPANRAGIYSLKASSGTVAVEDGVFRLTQEFDGVGGMARCPADLEALMRGVMGTSLAKVPALTWSDVSVGFVDPNVWDALQFQVDGKESVREQIVTKYEWAMTQIRQRGGSVVYPVELSSMESLQYERRSVLYTASSQQFPALVEAFCSRFQDSPVKSLRELIAFNAKNANRAMPEPHSDQDDLLKVLEDSTSPDTVAAATSYARQLAGPLGIDRCLSETGVEIIIGPGDCSICVVAALAGYPSAMIPLSTLTGDYGMGQPQGLMMVSSRGAERTMLAFMKLWEEIVGEWKVPSLLQGTFPPSPPTHGGM